MNMWIKNEKYHLIKEREFIAIYNIEDARVERLIKVDPANEAAYFKLNDTAWTMRQQEKRRMFERLNDLCPDLMKETDEEDARRLVRIEAAAEAYAESNSEYYSLLPEMILLNVKELLLFYRIRSFSADVPLQFSLFKRIENLHKLEVPESEAKMDARTINLVDLSICTEPELQEFESAMVRTNGIRIYYYDAGRELAAGAGYVGNEYGCLFCGAGPPKPQAALTPESAALISSLLQFELLKYNRNLMAFLNEDITLTKGKTFSIHKSALTARDTHHKRSSDCPCCSRHAASLQIQPI